jgi:hypothetical protein
MQFLIPWYGNVPDKVKWFTLRADGGWAATVAGAFAIGITLPFVAMLNPAVRRSPRALRVVGAVALAGIALHVAWLTAPGFGAAVLPPALAAVLALAALMAAAARLGPPAPRGQAHGR